MIVVGVRADPEPNDGVVGLNSDGAPSLCNAHRVGIDTVVDAFEVEAGMAGV